MMDETPEYLHELVTYGMVEGGFMPDPTENGAIEEGVAGTIRCLNAMTAQEEGTFDSWERDMFKAMTYDRKLLRILVLEVFRYGWKKGGHKLRPVDFIPEIEEDDLRKIIITRLQRYLDIFYPVGSNVDRIWRDQLDAIPCGFDENGLVQWQVYHAPTGFVIEDAITGSLEDAQDRINEFPARKEVSDD